MHKYLQRSIKRNLNRRANRFIQQQINHGIDGVLYGVLGTQSPQSRTQSNSQRATPLAIPSHHSHQNIERHVQMGHDDFDDCDEFYEPNGMNDCDNAEHLNTYEEDSMNHTTHHNAQSSFDNFRVSHQTRSHRETQPAQQPSEHPPRMDGHGTHLAHACYELINNKANSNAVLQGASGFFGVIATMAVDIGTIPLIYATMWNEIRAIYGQEPIETDDALKVITNILPEVLNDAIFDKVLGNIPMIGVYFNAICAKQMTWRLGTLFTLLASRGHDVQSIKCKEAMVMIRHMFPQKDMFGFVTPDYDKFIQLTGSVGGVSTERFNQKVESALNVFLAS